MAAPDRVDRSDALDHADRVVARRVILRLVRFGTRTGAALRQPAAALRAHEEPERFTRVLRQLCDAGRVRLDDDGAGEPIVELAAEASPEAWPELAAWLATHGPAEQLRRELESDAARWRARTGDRDAGLYDRDQLSELASWLTADVERDLGITDTARAFIAASRATARRRRWPGSAGGFLAVLLILVFLATPIILLLIVVLTASVIHRFG